MKKLLIVSATTALFLLVFIFFGKNNQQKPNNVQPNVPPLPEKPIPSISLEEVLASFSETNIRQNMEYLTSTELEGRMSGKKGNEITAEHIAKQLKSYGFQPAINGSYYQTFSIQNLNNFKEPGNGKTSNIVGILPGTTNNAIVIGAHCDHIGYGPSMSSSPNRREVHPGADDNASGTVALLEISRAFGALKGKNKNTIIVIFFSAEEMGLIGAKHYCNNAPFSINKTIFMLNMDMIGRYKMNNQLGVYGVNSLIHLKPVANKLATESGINIRTTNDTGGGSDHAEFARSGVPTVFLHTGQHAQYHTPDDKSSLIHYPELTKIARFAFALCWQADNSPPHTRMVKFFDDKKFVDHEIPEK